FLISQLFYLSNSYFPFFTCTLWSKWSLNSRLSQWGIIETQRYHRHMESLHTVFLRAPDSEKNKRNALGYLWHLFLLLSI
ncbi:hypothetical protein A4A49_62228, partial [Nicotiana attenuata]